MRNKCWEPSSPGLLHLPHLQDLPCSTFHLPFVARVEMNTGLLSVLGPAMPVFLTAALQSLQAVDLFALASLLTKERAHSVTHANNTSQDQTAACIFLRAPFLPAYFSG